MAITQKIWDWNIYKIVNPKNRVYIGITTDLPKRIKHYERADCRSQQALFHSFRKYGVSGHSFDLIESFTTEKDFAMDREIYWISYYKCNYSKLPEENGLNLTDGGRGSHGRVMSEETKALVNKEELLNKMKSIDTDADRAKNFLSVPRLEILNIKEEQEITLPNGEKRMEKLLCAPVFVEVGNKEDEYKKVLFAPKFEGILLTTTYKIVRKGDEKTIERFPTFFHSKEFDTYDNEPIVIMSGDKESFPMSWKHFSESFKDCYTRFTYAYILIGSDIYILALKPASGRILNQYKNSFERANSHFAMHNTNFDLETDATGDVTYHKLKVSSSGELSNEKIEEVLKMRADLIETIKQMNIPKNSAQLIIL